MKYDPIKRSLGSFFNKTPGRRILFYKLLDLLLLRAWHIKRAIREFRRNKPDNCSVLDAGAGFGQYTYFSAKIFPKGQITAIDIKEEQVEDCNRFFTRIGKGNRVQFIVSDLTELNEHEKYDLALSVDVMEHIEEDTTVFRNIFNSLVKGGVLLISTPSDQGGSDVHAEDDQSFIEEHVRDGYGIEEIRTKLNKAGFTEIHTRYSYGRPGKLSWKLSMKIPILLVNKSPLFYILLPFYYLVTFPVCLILNLLDVYNFHKSGTGLIVKAIK